MTSGDFCRFTTPCHISYDVTSTDLCPRESCFRDAYVRGVVMPWGGGPTAKRRRVTVRTCLSAIDMIDSVISVPSGPLIISCACVLGVKFSISTYTSLSLAMHFRRAHLFHWIAMITWKLECHRHLVHGHVLDKHAVDGEQIIADSHPPLVCGRVAMYVLVRHVGQSEQNVGMRMCTGQRISPTWEH